MQSLCRLFQESAGNHARDLGVPLATLFAQGMTWILSRFHIKIHRCPRVGERLRVATWPSGALGFYVVRDFQIFNDADECLVSSSSIWLILDLTRRTPLRMIRSVQGGVRPCVQQGSRVTTNVAPRGSALHARSASTSACG